ncbi:hypothetical protein [Nocardia cyriacigeorgica]|uniref:hypothetical protein n=1 Tax=Nocardia cyriacigeorgica TaxID=135487 RepID=UPI0024567ED4|nr:hypothetical protein [Nocardia cyriacigeorgica]
MVMSEVNTIYFRAAGPGAPALVKTELPAKIRKASEILGVRWPHDEWSAAADRTSKTRHKLAHLLSIDSIDGHRPHRMTIGRMGAPGEPHKAADRQPRGLTWRYIPDPDKDPNGVPWSQMTMQLDTVTEDEMADALGAMRWMRDCCRSLDYLGSLAKKIEHRRSLVLPKAAEESLPWWFLIGVTGEVLGSLGVTCWCPAVVLAADSASSYRRLARRFEKVVLTGP